MDQIGVVALGSLQILNNHFLLNIFNISLYFFFVFEIQFGISIRYVRTLPVIVQSEVSQIIQLFVQLETVPRVLMTFEFLLKLLFVEVESSIVVLPAFGLHKSIPGCVDRGHFSLVESRGELLEILAEHVRVEPHSLDHLLSAIFVNFVSKHVKGV